MSSPASARAAPWRRPSCSTPATGSTRCWAPRRQRDHQLCRQDARRHPGLEARPASCGRSAECRQPQRPDGDREGHRGRSLEGGARGQGPRGPRDRHELRHPGDRGRRRQASSEAPTAGGRASRSVIEAGAGSGARAPVTSQRTIADHTTARLCLMLVLLRRDINGPRPVSWRRSLPSRDPLTSPSHLTLGRLSRGGFFVSPYGIPPWLL